MLEQPPHVVSAFINAPREQLLNLINKKVSNWLKKYYEKRRSSSEIEVIAYEVGFNSKSPFIVHFINLLRNHFRLYSIRCNNYPSHFIKRENSSLKITSHFPKRDFSLNDSLYLACDK
jgi:AraC-like DNA-binding protein